MFACLGGISPLSTFGYTPIDARVAARTAKKTHTHTHTPKGLYASGVRSGHRHRGGRENTGIGDAPLVRMTSR